MGVVLESVLLLLLWVLWVLGLGVLGVLGVLLVGGLMLVLGLSIVTRSNVAICTHRLPIRMLDVPQRVLNTVKIKHRYQITGQDIPTLC